MESSPDALVYNNPAAIRAAKDIAFGSAAGMVSKVFEHPFDLTKVRLQAQVLQVTTRFNGPFDCLAKTWRNEGVSGLYRGLPAPIVGAMAENATLFLTYSELQTLIRWTTSQPLSQSLSLAQLALAGAGAGAVTSFLLTPIELVKCKMQVQMLAVRPSPESSALGSRLTPSQLPGPISVLTSIIRNTGFRGLWLGHTGTFIREGGGTAAWFATKEFVSSLLVNRRHAHLKRSNMDVDPQSLPSTRKPDLLLWESALSGACAGAAFNIALFPADTVKSAMQTEEELRPRSQVGNSRIPPQPRTTFLGTFKAMYKAHGIRGLYAGCGITVARSIPSSAIIFLIYDGLCRWFG